MRAGARVRARLCVEESLLACLPTRLPTLQQPFEQPGLRVASVQCDAPRGTHVCLGLRVGRGLAVREQRHDTQKAAGTASVRLCFNATLDCARLDTPTDAPTLGYTIRSAR